MFGRMPQNSLSQCLAPVKIDKAQGFVLNKPWQNCITIQIGSNYNMPAKHLKTFAVFNH